MDPTPEQTPPTDAAPAPTVDQAPEPAPLAVPNAPAYEEGAAVTARISDEDETAVAATVVAPAASSYDPALPSYLTDQFTTVIVRTADGASIGVPAHYVSGSGAE